MKEHAGFGSWRSPISGRNLFTYLVPQKPNQAQGDNLKRENCRIFMWDGWIRRRVVWYLQKKKVTKWQARRTGQCLRCGKCCGQCPALDTKSMRCRIYSIRPAICKAFPLTPDDIKNLKCGFRFKK